VFFDSMATNLVPGDTNGHTDVFVRDLTRRTTTRISVSRSGAQGNGESFLTAMSPNGRYVAITSEASNLAPGDTNGVFDSFIYDVWTNSLSRVLPGLGGAEGNDNVEVTDISSDGRFLAFLATATNLVPNDVNERVDAFVYDRLWRRTELVSISTSGEYNDGEGWSPSISGDGRYVAFYGNGSVLSPLVGPFVDHVYVRDRLTRTTTLVSVNVNGDPADGNAQALDVSLDGRYVLISSDAANLVPDDTNGHADAFVYDRLARSLRRISLSESGVEGNEQSWPGKMSADGSIVGVTTRADNLFDSDTNGFDDVLAIDWRRLPN
jgi:Tol biopolymer transport system component